jgi:putative transposase
LIVRSDQEPQDGRCRSLVPERLAQALSDQDAKNPDRQRPEYISETLRIWAEKQGITIQHIQPGQPQQNAYVERYNRTVRHEWLDQYIIESTEEAQDQATQWLWTYNNDRPNMGIGGITPAMKLKMAA